MRADRLISIVLLLQANGRMTAETLASRLEVSQRTILRDMDALSSAGVPVIAERGTGGGWRLIDGYETKLTGLTPAEIRSLFLARPPALLAELGLKLKGDHRYRVVGEYENPTGHTLIRAAMAHMSGLFAPEDMSDWPKIDPSNPDYRRDLVSLQVNGEHEHAE